jgi:hypothetical protein
MFQFIPLHGSEAHQRLSHAVRQALERYESFDEWVCTEGTHLRKVAAWVWKDSTPAELYAPLCGPRIQTLAQDLLADGEWTDDDLRELGAVVLDQVQSVLSARLERAFYETAREGI